MALSRPRQQTGFDRWVASQAKDDPRFAKALADDRELIARVDAVVTALRSVLEASTVPVAAFARSLAEHPARLAKMERFVKTAGRTVVAATAPTGSPIVRVARTVRAFVDKRRGASTALARR